MKKQKQFLFTLVLAVFLFNVSFYAQEKNDEMENKLKQIKGNIEKITVKVDGKDVVFEGKDAEKLGQGLKMFSKVPKLTWISEDDANSKGPRVMKFKINDGADLSSKSGDEKKVEVKIEDGKKKVTVTTTKDGKEETKVYEGEEAEKFLQENKEESNFDFYLNSDEDSDGSVIIMKHSGGDDCCCCGKRMHKMRMPIHEKGAKKIIIEKIEKDEKKNDVK